MKHQHRATKTKTASAAGDVEGLAKLVAPILRELLDRASPDVPVAAIEIARAAIAHVGMGVEAVFRQRISELADQVDVSRGNLLVHVHNVPRVGQTFEAMLVWRGGGSGRGSRSLTRRPRLPA